MTDALAATPPKSKALPSFDISHTPLSFAGSWLNISPVLAEGILADDLHLVSHRNGPHPVLSLTPTHDDERAETEWQADPSGLLWSCPGTAASGRIELTFAGPDVLRIRGQGLGLRLGAADGELTPFAGSYAFTDPDGTFVFTSYQTGHRYRVAVLSGQASLLGDQALGEACRVVLIPDGQAGWEVQLGEYRSGRAQPVGPASFDEVAARTREEFLAFAESIASSPDEGVPTATFAAYVLWSALVAPDGFVQRPSILMSKHWMDKVWAWDPCFNALALASGQPELALHQFLAMFDHQDATGALPDSVTHSEILFNFVKPPVHGWAFARLRALSGRPFTQAELTDVFDKLSRWTDFWLDHRRAPGSVLCHYEHGNDSGWDNSTVFATERLVETADLATFLILQLEVLASLADELGHADVARERAGQARLMRQALFATLWDGRRFRARGVFSGDLRSSDSLLDLMPIMLGDSLPADVRVQLASDLKAHVEAAGLATERTSSPFYDADGYWRGPVWAPPTVLIEDGLRRAGQALLADQVAANYRWACETSGFAENFDALTGRGLRDRAYTWTASGYLILRPPR
jgi:hypothetical protein